MQEHYTVSIIINLGFWLVGIAATGYHLYRLFYWLGRHKLGPAALWFLNLKYPLLCTRFAFDKIAKIRGFNYRVETEHYNGKKFIYENLSFCESADKFDCEAESSQSWRSIKIISIRKGTEKTVRSISF